MMTKKIILTPLVWACLVVVLASLPYIFGMAIVGEGQVFSGFTYNIDDACVYSSWIRQVADGNILFKNLYTSQPQQARQFNLFILILGLAARVLHLSPAAVIHISRVILGVTLLLLISRFAAPFLLDSTGRRLVIPVVGLASGLGWLFASMAGHSGPVDLWQPEAITFLSIYLNPLFLIALILMIGAFHFLIRIMETGSWRDAVFAGLTLLLLANIHTYDVLTVGAVWVAYLVVNATVQRRISWDRILQCAVAAGISLPAVAYQFYLYRANDVFRERVQTAAPSPALWAYLAGFGILLLLAIAGAAFAIRRRKEAVFPAVWILVGLALPYLPFAQQRKLIMGLHIPIAILAVIALSAIIRRVGTRWAGAVSVPLVLLLIPSNLLFMARDMFLLEENSAAPMFRPYLNNAEVEAMNWLRRNTSRSDTVLAFPEVALFTPAIAGNQVYYGHWSETPAYGAKLNAWRKFIDPNTGEEERIGFLRESGSDYIVYYRDMPVDDFVDLNKKDYLQQVFSAGDVVVFRVVDGKIRPIAQDEQLPM